MVSSRYLLERIVQSVITIFSVLSLSFFLIHQLPGGPLAYLKAQLASAGNVEDAQQLQQLAEVYTGFEPNKPLWQQYVDYMSGIIFELDLGQSLWYDDSVSHLYAEAIPWTAFVMILGVLINFAIIVMFGATAAYREGSYFDYVTSSSFQVLGSIPYYVAALLLLYQFGYRWRWFPTGGKMPSVEPGVTPAFILGVLSYAFLPILSIVIAQMGRMLNMRGNSVSTLGEDYLRVARIRGIPSLQITTRYVVRNSILPLYTGLIITLGTVFGGSVILEQIFQYEGAGLVLFEAVVQRDYITMMGGFLVITVAVTVGIFIADLTYGMIDPRIQEGRQ
jgi:peptide/nickel transport system permease protein